MKILVCNRPSGAFGYISDSWINTLLKAGFDAKRWDGLEGSWKSYRPDLYIACSGHKQPIPPKRLRGKCLVAVHVNPWGPIAVEPNINENQQNINWVIDQQPDCVFGYGLEEHRKYWQDWDKNNIPWCPMATAGDVTQFSDHKTSRSSNLVYLGGYWPYKAKNLDKFLIPTLRHFKNYRLAGWGSWPVKSEGELTTSANDFFNTGKTAPCVSEPHTTIHGIDLPERVFKVILSGCVAVHDDFATHESYFKSVKIAKTPWDMIGLIEGYVANSEVRRATQQAQLKELLEKHTYNHRLAGLFKTLNLNGSEALLNNIPHVNID